jgi:tripartite ATP-independent transporter DctP family solute receptor
MKKNSYRFLVLALVIVMAAAMTGCGGSSEPAPAPDSGSGDAAAAEPTVLKFGTTVNEQDSFQVAAEKFAELVKEGTNGAYEIEIYPNGALGDERTMLESMQMGTLDMGIITSGPFVNFTPEMGVLDLPFLFSSSEEAYKILDGDIGKELLTKLEGSKLKGLAYAERGFRNLTNSKKPVAAAADIKGLKVRVMQNDVYIASFNALGVNAVPMAWTEALTALQQGTIDGQENPINVIYSHKLWETQKYCTLTRHAYASAIITMSLDLYNKLPADVQKVFTDAAQGAAEYERNWDAENETSQLQEMKDNGMEVIENPDVDSFKAAVQSVYDQYPQYADYLTRIQDELK